MKRLNPYATALKKSLKHLSERRKAAREVMRKKRLGQKVDAKELAKSAALLGMKLRKYKDFKKDVAAKKAKLNATKEKVDKAKQHRAQKAEAEIEKSKQKK